MAQQFHTIVSFRVASDPTVGFGHLSRMLALRKIFKHRVRWFVDPGTKTEVNKRVSKKDKVYEERSVGSIAQLLSFNNAQANGLVICDDFRVHPDGFAKANLPVVYFCDSDTAPISKNLTVVNCQPGATSNKNCFAGPSFMPIDTRGKKQIETNFATLRDPVRCLIGFGAIDSCNRTALALNALLLDQKLKERVTPICLLGPHFKYDYVVETLLKMFAKSKIIRNCASVLEVPHMCDIAVGAPGLSHAERLYRGIPTVLVPQNNKHIALCMRWQSEGCALYARPDPKHIASQINALITNQFERAQAISIEGQRVVDGKGASRIVSELTIRGFAI
jgi:spore coat polysaccharide biosynthesis predicted glycosyltransferase SpsG